MLDGTVDDLQHLQPLSARVVVDHDRYGSKTTDRRGKEQASFEDLLPKPLLDGHAVEHRLQCGATANDEILGRSVLARLVIGHAQQIEVGAMFDQIDRTSEQEPAIDENRIGQAARIAALVVQAKTELEVCRPPIGFVRHLLNPDAEVAPHFVDLVAPDAFDRRHQRLLILRRHAVDHRVEPRHRRRQRLARHRQRADPIQLPVELRLHLVKQTAAGQRIHAHQRLGLVPRFEAIDRREQELIRARRETLQRRQRIRPLLQTLGGERGLGSRRDLNQPVARGPDGSPTRPTADHRAPQRFVEPEQIVRVPFHGRGIARVEQWLQRGEVVFEIVDRSIGILRRGPRKARAAFVGRFGCQHAMVRHAAGDRAHDVERVERGHARPRLADVEPRIREIQPLARRTDRDIQQ